MVSTITVLNTTVADIVSNANAGGTEYKGHVVNITAIPFLNTESNYDYLSFRNKLRRL